MIKSGNFKNGSLPAGIVPFNPGRILIQLIFAVENPLIKGARLQILRLQRLINPTIRQASLNQEAS
jgi:hypothetical protein